MKSSAVLSTTLHAVRRAGEPAMTTSSDGEAIPRPRLNRSGAPEAGKGVGNMTTPETTIRGGVESKRTRIS